MSEAERVGGEVIVKGEGGYSHVVRCCCSENGHNARLVRHGMRLILVVEVIVWGVMLELLEACVLVC